MKLDTDPPLSLHRQSKPMIKFRENRNSFIRLQAAEVSRSLQRVCANLAPAQTQFPFQFSINLGAQEVQDHTMTDDSAKRVGEEYNIEERLPLCQHGARLPARLSAYFTYRQTSSSNQVMREYLPASVASRLPAFSKR
ncbi:Hypothetical protein NTJ_01606 [Nesidiocoris tenuis]|uniref:Uncharacterized protein n=1 Tax=Nesidiocoris tenuis TaxID=355587 RepID=A0ABN7A909_9HEMI|nr:Hypothetical protein NTJ_01606 [Nesidiocoris tenuis]